MYDLMLGWQGLHLRENANGLDGRLNVWLFACPADLCYYTVSGQDEADARQKGSSHKCPHSGTTHFGAQVTMTIIEECWIAADREMDKLLDGNLEGAKLEQQRGILKGMSHILAVFGTPFYKSTKDVADELRKRRNMRDAGEAYESPGLGSRRYTMPAEIDSKQQVVTVQQRADKVLTEGEQKAIAFAHAQMPEQFTHAFLAKKYSVSLEVIAQICS